MVRKKHNKRYLRTKHWRARKKETKVKSTINNCASYIQEDCRDENDTMYDNTELREKNHHILPIENNQVKSYRGIST